MARVQHVQEANKKKQNKDLKSSNPVKSKTELAKTNTRREPTKNEILFFRVGISVMAITLITVAIIFTVQYFMNKKDEKGFFDDFISLNAEELKHLTGLDDNSGVYGDFTYFQGKDQYKDLFDLINQNDKIYIYFYSSSSLNDDIMDAIDAIDLEGVAFFIVNLDTQGSLLSGPDYAHLKLNLERSNLLVTFDVEKQEFDIEIRVSDIVREIGKI